MLRQNITPLRQAKSSWVSKALRGKIKNRGTDTEIIEIPPIKLVWSDWTPWNQLAIDSRSGEGVIVPNDMPGVYEVRYSGVEERLTIGKAADLRMRLKQGLVKGKTPHSAGQAIRISENTSKLVVRWAVTERPSAVEEELHKRYQAKFGKLPKYVQHT
jgi:hypothetical protein